MLGEIATQILTLCSEQHSREARSETGTPASDRVGDGGRMAQALRGLLPALDSDLRPGKRPHRLPCDAARSRTGPGTAASVRKIRSIRATARRSRPKATPASPSTTTRATSGSSRRFVNAYGGLWLLSDGETEQAVSDAIYRIDLAHDRKRARRLVPQNRAPGNARTRSCTASSRVWPRPRSDERPTASGRSGSLPASASGSPRSYRTRSTSRPGIITRDQRDLPDPRSDRGLRRLPRSDRP